MSAEMMRLSALHVTPLLQTRDGGLCKEAVADYTARSRAGQSPPALLAYKVTDRKFPAPVLVAGFHRHAALTTAGVTEHPVELREGTFAEAWLAGYRSNLDNGVRYSNADKRKAAEQALLLFTEDSAAAVAERLSVSDEFVRKVRKELVAAGKLDMPETVTRKDGSGYPATLTHSSDGANGCPTVGDATPPRTVVTDEDEEAFARASGLPADLVDDEPEPAPPPLNGTLPKPSVDAAPKRRNPYGKKGKGGNKVDPNHPFYDLLVACSTLSAAITKVITTPEGAVLREYLTPLAKHAYKFRHVVYSSAGYDGDVHKPSRARFVGLHPLRGLIKLAGSGTQLKPADVVKAFAELCGASPEQILQLEEEES